MTGDNVSHALILDISRKFTQDAFFLRRFLGAFRNPVLCGD